MKNPPFNDRQKRIELLDRLNEIPDVQFSEDAIEKRARVRFSKLRNGEAVERLKAAISWLTEQVNAQSAP